MTRYLLKVLVLFPRRGPDKVFYHSTQALECAEVPMET